MEKKKNFYWRCNAVDNIRPCIDLLDFNKQLWKEERPPLKTPSSFKAGDAHALIDWYHTPLLLSRLININKSKYSTEWPSLQTLYFIHCRKCSGLEFGRTLSKRIFLTAKVVSCQFFRWWALKVANIISYDLSFLRNSVPV